MTSIETIPPPRTPAKIIVRNRRRDGARDENADDERLVMSRGSVTKPYLSAAQQAAPWFSAPLQHSAVQVGCSSGASALLVSEKIHENAAENPAQKRDDGPEDREDGPEQAQRDHDAVDAGLGRRDEKRRRRARARAVPAQRRRDGDDAARAERERHAENRRLERPARNPCPPRCRSTVSGFTSTERSPATRNPKRRNGDISRSVDQTERPNSAIKSCTISSSVPLPQYAEPGQREIVLHRIVRRDRS